MLLLYLFLLLPAILTGLPSNENTENTQIDGDIPLTCDSTIYCSGSLLHHVQMANLYTDSKTFVDMRLLADEAEIMAEFEKLLEESGNEPKREELEAFVKKYFEEGDELEEWLPPDYHPEPRSLRTIKDPNLLRLAKQLVATWPSLAVRVRPTVHEQPHRYSIIPVPNGFIKPGGRFRELYYWDTYWIVEGLVASGMVKTAEGVVDNLVHLVERLGHMPNGARLYYTHRSQPPLLTYMAEVVFNTSKNRTWLNGILPALEKEMEFWLGRGVEVGCGVCGKCKLLRYHAPSLGPRPESYREDYTTAAALPTDESKEKLYTELKSGAETGWDFSSRWFNSSSITTKTYNLSSIQTSDVIPVDLNAFICGAMRRLAQWTTGEKKVKWVEESERLAQNLQAVLWNEQEGVWQDYIISQATHRNEFYPSNLAPLWADCFPANPTSLPNRIISYLNSKKIWQYLGGIPTSLHQTGEQWDYPNAWPPLQEMLVTSLEKLNSREAGMKAVQLADRYVKSVLIGHNESGHFYEKYDCNEVGKHGGGGEYVVQTGFGWTNGVALKLLTQYGDQLPIKKGRKIKPRKQAPNRLKPIALRACN